MPPFKLRAALHGHSADVRGVASSPQGLVASVSRDASGMLWDLSAPSAPLAKLVGHDHFVNCVAFAADGGIVTASSDATVRLWGADGTAGAVLNGHDKNVCHVSVTASGAILSSSWDCTVRVWEGGVCKVVLRGHEAAVWAAEGLEDGRIVTVGGDRTIRVWEGDGSAHFVLPSAHGDVVRAIAAAPRGGFVTVSNDSSAVCWRPEGRSFVAGARISDLHDGSFAYAVSASEVGGQWVWASGGEDNAVRIVEGDGERFECVQTIFLPGVVWTVAFTPEGDVVAGCSDGVTRVFTKNAGKVADADVIEEFEKAVAERQVSAKVIGGVDVAKLPLAEEALSVDGVKEGENKMVRTAAGGAEVHMWGEGKWVKVGDIVESPDGATSMGGGELQGKKYDFVFEVEIGDGGKKEKLGFNRGENSYTAAQRFIDDHEINQDHLDQIAKFVEEQVPADAVGTKVGGGSVGGGSGGRNLPLPPPRKCLPHPTGLVSYATSDQLPKLQSKLAEFNTQLATQKSDLALNEDEAVVFGTQLMPQLKDKSGASIVFTDDECAVVGKMLKWPVTMAFPVLDLARLVIAKPSAGAYFFGKHNGDVLDIVLGHVASPDAGAAVLIMGCRFMCNLFGNRIVLTTTRSRCAEILAALAGASKSENRRVREHYASLLVNYAVALHGSAASVEERTVPMKAAVALLGQSAMGGEKDVEVAFRLAVAIGTLMCGGDEYAAMGVELGAATAAANSATLSARLQQVALEIATLCAS